MNTLCVTLKPGRHFIFQLSIIACGQPPKPHPKNLRDCWDSDHVRMPFSEHSLYPVQEVCKVGLMPPLKHGLYPV
jgi:hypothetical protein